MEIEAGSRRSSLQKSLQKFLPGRAASEAPEGLLGKETLTFACLLVLCILGSYVTIRSHCGLLPESSVAIVVGAAFGAVLHWADPESDFWEFHPDVFFYVLLPPIIFEAGYTLKRRMFLDNIVPILTFAVVGTLISTVVLTGVLVLAGKLGWLSDTTLSLENGPLQAMQFGALISAVDPVATLAVLSSAEVNADHVLQSILFGESVLNDAVSIVLFQTLNKVNLDDFSSSIGTIVLQFFEISICSTLIGVSVALLLSLLLRNCLFYEEAVHLEIVLTLGAAYGAYATAEALSYSGVLSLFFCGILLGHYNWYNLSSSGKLVTGHVCKCLAYLCETLVFAYLGLSLFNSDTWREFDAGFLGVSALGCLLGRALNIFPLAVLLNATRKQQIDLRMQTFLWFSGLRGAIAFALSQRFPQESQANVVSTTIVLVLASTLGLGGGTAPLVKLLRLTQPSGSALPSRTASATGAAAAAQPLMDPTAGGDGGRALPPLPEEEGWMMRRWRTLDHDYLQPWFGGAAGVRRGRSTPGVSRAASAHERAQQLTRGGGSGGSGGGSFWQTLASSRAGGSGGGSFGWGCGGSGPVGGAEAGAEAAAEQEVADEIYYLIRRGTHDPFVTAPGPRARPQRGLSGSGLDHEAHGDAGPSEPAAGQTTTARDPLVRAIRGEQRQALASRVSE